MQFNSTISSVTSFFGTPAGATIILAIVTVGATIVNIYFLWSNERNYRKHIHLEMLKDKCLSILDGNILGNVVLFAGDPSTFDPKMYFYAISPPKSKWWDVFEVASTSLVTRKGDDLEIRSIPLNLYRDMKIHFPLLYKQLTEFEKRLKKEVGEIFTSLCKSTRQALATVGLPDDYDYTTGNFRSLIAQSRDSVENHEKYKIVSISILRLINMDMEWCDFVDYLEHYFLPLPKDKFDSVKSVYETISQDSRTIESVKKYKEIATEYDRIDNLIKDAMAQVTLTGKCGFLRGSSV